MTMIFKYSFEKLKFVCYNLKIQEMFKRILLILALSSLILADQVSHSCIEFGLGCGSCNNALCLACKPGYSSLSHGCPKNSCSGSTNCDLCLADGKCLRCNYGFSAAGYSNCSKTQCGTNCLICRSASYCESCKPNYYNSKGSCL